MNNEIATNVIDPYAKQRAMSFSDFVKSLLDCTQDPQKLGRYIQRADGHNTRVDIVPKDGKVLIRMDDVDMGYFEEMTQQGYKCAFHQKYRNGIKQELLPNESIMKSICSTNPLVLFYDA